MVVRRGAGKRTRARHGWFAQSSPGKLRSWRRLRLLENQIPFTLDRGSHGSSQTRIPWWRSAHFADFRKCLKLKALSEIVIFLIVAEGGRSISTPGRSAILACKQLILHGKWSPGSEDLPRLRGD